MKHNLGQDSDVYRYRRQYGVNLGSWFVLEKWITSAPFLEAASPATSDYDVAIGNRPREILEHHWDTWIIDEDWKWIVDHGVNSVRLPIGYYHLYALDPSIVVGTPFDKVGWVFEGAWPRICAAIKKAESYGVGVLIDLHAAPGKQNGDAHSGINGPVKFYEKQHLQHTTNVLTILANEISGIPNVVGLELVNEPQNNALLPRWYQTALDSIREKVGTEFPLYISDCWNTGSYSKFIQSREDFVVLDHHLYRCYTADDLRQSGEELAERLPPESLVNGFETTAGNIVVGEFSAALNPSSLRSSEAGEQDRQRRVFAQAELRCFQMCTAGFWFWTLKKDGWDAGWSLKNTVQAEITPQYHGIRREKARLGDDKERAEKEAKIALTQHENYWSQQGGSGYERWRFELGFLQGWEDAFLFFMFRPNGSGAAPCVSELGFVGEWLKRRRAEHVSDNGHSQHIWEFDHGFRQGLRKAKEYFLGG